ncbi:unnamed protein product, partial [marine sediment metagenome]
MLGTLSAYVGKDGYAYPSIEQLALEMRLNVRQVRRLIGKLKRAEAISVEYTEEGNRYRMRGFQNSKTFIYVWPVWITRLGLSVNEACVLGYVYYRCNGKPETWFSLAEAAEALGLCPRTIEMCLAVLAAWEFIEIRPGRKSRGRTNRYQLGSFGRLASWENYEHVPAQKCPPMINTYPTDSYSYANSVRNSPKISQSG